MAFRRIKLSRSFPCLFDADILIDTLKIQDATDKHVGMIDDLLNNAKKELAKA